MAGAGKGLPKKITVDVDSREKTPIIFPASVAVMDPLNLQRPRRINITTRVIKLPFGDYRLAEYSDCCVVERKAGQRELYKNLFDLRDSVRQARSFRRLVGGCRYPYILLEVAPTEMVRTNPTCRGLQTSTDVDMMLNRLNLVFVRYGLHVIWIPWRGRKRHTRLLLGRFLVHTMLGYALRDEYETEGLADASAAKTT